MTGFLMPHFCLTTPLLAGLTGLNTELTRMRITTDWHIHTKHSPCGSPESDMARVCAEVEAAGIIHYGLTDHLHTVRNEAALAGGRADFDTVSPSVNRLFGVEVSCLREYDLAVNAEYMRTGEGGSIWGICPGGPAGPLTIYLPDELVERLGIRYVIGGAHWPLGLGDAFTAEQVTSDYHRQNMFLAAHPRVNIVAHPWWWMGRWQDADYNYRTDPWLDDFRRIPQSMHDEFAAAVVQHGKAVEINAGAILLNPFYPATFRAQYREYLAGLKARGVRFTLASDSHAPGYNRRLLDIEDDLDDIGLTAADFWSPLELMTEHAPGARA